MRFHTIVEDVWDAEKRREKQLNVIGKHIPSREKVDDKPKSASKKLQEYEAAWQGANPEYVNYSSDLFNKLHPNLQEFLSFVVNNYTPKELKNLVEAGDEQVIQQDHVSTVTYDGFNLVVDGKILVSGSIAFCMEYVYEFNPTYNLKAFRAVQMHVGVNGYKAEEGRDFYEILNKYRRIRSFNKVMNKVTKMQQNKDGDSSLQEVAEHDNCLIRGDWKQPLQSHRAYDCTAPKGHNDVTHLLHLHYTKIADPELKLYAWINLDFKTIPNQLHVAFVEKPRAHNLVALYEILPPSADPSTMAIAVMAMQLPQFHTSNITRIKKQFVKTPSREIPYVHRQEMLDKIRYKRREKRINEWRYKPSNAGPGRRLVGYDDYIELCKDKELDLEAIVKRHTNIYGIAKLGYMTSQKYSYNHPETSFAAILNDALRKGWKMKFNKGQWTVFSTL